MTFAFLPDDGPSRLIRYVDGFEGDDENVVLAVYFKEQNALLVNRGLFSQLSKTEQRSLLRTHAQITVFEPALTTAA